MGIGPGSKHVAKAGLAAALMMAASTWVQAQDFPPGTALGQAWAAFVAAQDAEDAPRALERIAAVEALVQARHGRESAEMAAVLGRRAVTLMRLGRLTEAEGVAREALSISGRVSGPESPATLDATHTLAVVFLGDRGDGPAQRNAYAAEAVRLLEGALATGGSASPEATGLMRNSLATAYGLTGRHDEAIALYQAMLEALASRPPTDPEVVTLSVNLAQTYVAAGRDEEAELLLGDRVGRVSGAAAQTLQHANLLSTYARVTLFPERRAPALRRAAAIYHRAGCPEAEALRDRWVAAGGRGYPWSTADPACPGDLRLARELSGFRGLAYVARLEDPPRYFASVRLLAQASDVVVGATRLTYARNAEARLAFNRYRHVHREFVASAWAAGQ